MLVQVKMYDVDGVAFIDFGRVVSYQMLTVIQAFEFVDGLHRLGQKIGVNGVSKSIKKRHTEEISVTVQNQYVCIDWHSHKQVHWYTVREVFELCNTIIQAAYKAERNSKGHILLSAKDVRDIQDYYVSDKLQVIQDKVDKALNELDGGIVIKSVGYISQFIKRAWR
jgi:Glu-tRNA(Gln) amidotransferase subunit E-like FAD-binding protein